MTRSEYQELVEFLGPKFEAIDGRFDAIEGRLTRVEVSVEESRHHIQLLAEAITSVDRKLDRFREETGAEFQAVRNEMAQGFHAQSQLIESLGARMDRWEGHPA